MTILRFTNTRAYRKNKTPLVTGTNLIDFGLLENKNCSGNARFVRVIETININRMIAVGTSEPKLIVQSLFRKISTTTMY